MRVVECAPGAEHITALQAAGLPIDDLHHDVTRRWWRAEDDHGWLGLIALERHGAIGLVRSLLVREGLRRTGTGRRLVAAAEQAALDSGLDALYLLTTDADAYFARHDYVVIDRSEVPEVLRATAQYSRLCPASARVMRKALLR